MLDRFPPDSTTAAALHEAAEAVERFAPQAIANALPQDDADHLRRQLNNL